MNVHSKNVRHAGHRHARPPPRLAQSSTSSPPARQTCACRCAKSCSIPRPRSRICGFTTPPAPIPKSDPHIDLAAGLPPSPRKLARRAQRARNLSGSRGQGRGQWQCLRRGAGRALPRPAHFAPRASMACSVTQFEFARAGIITEEMILCRPSRKSRTRGGAGRGGGAHQRWRKLWRGNPRIRDAGIRALGNRARTGDHSRPISTTPNSSR